MASCPNFDNVLRQFIQIFDCLNSQEDIAGDISLLRKHCERVLAENRKQAADFGKKITVRSCEFSKLQFPKSQEDRSAHRVPTRSESDFII